MKDARLVLNSALLCVPAVLLVAAGAYFLLDKVPEIVRNEQRRVTQEYRELAVEARDASRGAPFDFSASGLKRGDLKIRREPWGFGHGYVWYVKNGQAFRATVAPVESTNYRRLFYPAVVAVLLLVLALTAFGVHFFWKFVRSRDDFLAATAHDLMTPLVGMRMMIGRCDGEAKKLNERMILIVDNIKDFLRMGGVRRRPQMTDFDVEALCREAYRLFAADYEESESGPVAFAFSGSGLVPRVCADETMTLQVLWNLFGNDLKYAAPYGKVSVRSVVTDKLVTVEFVDEGQGMTLRQRRRAFDRYYRAKTVLESGKGGFGIGLCTAREFARAMGGDLTVRANSPKGCVFSLSLVRAPA